MPTPVPGQALLAGRVHDGAGAPIAGALLTIAETDGAATTGADGRYTLTVPSDSTLTLTATAPGYARSHRESVVLAAQAMVGGFDLLMLASDELDALNAMATPPVTTGVGVIAVVLHALDPACDATGAQLSVFPPNAARVFYSRPDAAGGLDVPDPTATSVQPGVTVAAWLADAVPPGNMIAIEVDRPGCAVMAPSPSFDGLVYPGLRRADAQALTQADLFLSGQQ